MVTAVQLEHAYKNLDEMERRAPTVVHRARYLRLINDYGRRSLDAQREWLDAVQQELDRPAQPTTSSAATSDRRTGTAT